MSDFKTFVALGMAPALAKEVDKGIQNGGANAIQKDGGIASRTVVQATGATASRVAGDRAADTRSVADFSGESLTKQIIAADADGRGIITVPAGTNMALDGSDDLSAANKSVWKSDDKKLVDEQQGNRGNYVHWSAYGSAPDQFGPTVRPEHLKQAGKAARETGKIVYMNVGDSIGAVASDPCEMAVYPNAVVEMLQRDNPGVEVEHINQAIGGTKISDFVSTSYPAPAWQDPLPNESWQANCARKNPDVVVIHFLGNDIPNFVPEDVLSTVKFWQAQEKVPDIIFAITYRPSYSKDVDAGESELVYYTEAWQNAFQASVSWLRLYCQAHGFGYIDFDRYVASERDGYDVEDVALAKVPALAGTSLSAYEAWLPMTGDNYGNGKWLFPLAPSATGTSASACTDASLIHDFDTLPNSLIYTLFPAGGSGIGKITFDIGLYIWFNDASGNIAWSYSDGTTDPNTNKTVTAVPVPKTVSQASALQCSLEVVGARVRFRVFSPLPNNPAWKPGYPLFFYGTGLTVVCDFLMARPVSPQQFVVTGSGLSSANIKLHRLCVGDRSKPGPDVHRYVPSTPCYNLYSEINGDVQLIGGSNAFHMNSHGMRDTQWRAVRDQDWRVYSYEKNPALETLSVQNNVFLGAKPNGTPGVYQWYDNGGYNVALDPGTASPGEYVTAYKNGVMDTTVGSNGFVAIRDGSYNYTHYTAHAFKGSVFLPGNAMGIIVNADGTQTTLLNATAAAPASPTSGGFGGEFRIDDNYLYFCRDGKWRRVAFDTAWT